MALNDSEVSSNCTFQSEMNSSGVFECTDSYPGYFLIAFYTLVNAVLMLPLNGWVLWLARRSAGVTNADFVILNQSVAEIIGNSCIPTFLIGTMLKKKIFILISVYLSSTLTVGRPLFQTYFCVERYLAVVHPLVYLKYTKALKHKMLLVGLVWLTILTFAWFNMDSYPRVATFYIGIYLAMLVICAFCSVMILWVLKRPKPGDGEKDRAYQLKRKAFRAVTAILITLVFGYGSVSCAVLLRDRLPYSSYCLVLGFSWCTLLPSAAVQPYLYLSKVKNH